MRRVNERLAEIRASGLRCRTLYESQQRLRDSVTRITAQWRDTPAGGGPADRMLEYAARLDELDALIDEIIRAHLDARLEMLDAIRMLRNPHQQEILILRYFDCLSWNKIAR